MIEDLTSAARSDCVRVIESFERAWFSGVSPDIISFLPPLVAWRQTLLVELILIDIEFRRKQRETVELDHYLARFAELKDNPYAMSSLNDGVADLESSLRTSCRPEVSDLRITKIDSRSAMNGTAQVVRANDGKFRILRLHSRGGLGQVSVAVDEELRREVALKEIQPKYADDPISRQRFVAEVEITGSLEHPGIVPVYRLGWYPDGRPFYAMRFIQGESLKAALDRFHSGDNPNRRHQSARDLELRQFLRRLIDVCNAVEYAHSRGIIHRDLKPANIMLGKYGETLVVDWGLAKRFGGVGGSLPLEPSTTFSFLGDSDRTQLGSAIGTPGYMSPEQAEGRNAELGPATDIYSLGATLNHVLTGRPPSLDKVDASTTEKTDAPSPIRLHKSPIDVPRALKAIVLKATSAIPTDRFPNAKSLADEIERWLADEPVLVDREPLMTRLARWSRRHRTLVGTVATLLFASLVTTTIAAFAISSARERAFLADRQTLLERQKADQADKQAQINQRTASEVAELLQQLFRSADPIAYEGFGMRDGRQRAADVTARQLLDAAAKEVRERLTESPEIQSALFETMGNSYRGLSEYQMADEFLNSSLNIRRRLFGDDHVNVASSLFSLGILKQDTGQYDEAERLYRQALDLQVRLIGADDLIVARSKFQLAWVLSQQPFTDGFQRDRNPEAEEFIRGALAIRRDKLGSNHHDVGVTLATLAGIRMASGDEKECLALLIEAFRILDRPENASDVGSATVFFVQGEAFRQMRQYNQGAEMHQKVAEITRRQLGDQHPMYAVMLANLAGIQRQAGNLIGAEKNIRETLSIARKSSMRSQPNVLDMFIQLADGLRGRQDNVEAESLYRDVIKFGGETQNPRAKTLVERAQQRLDDMLNQRAASEN